MSYKELCALAGETDWTAPAESTVDKLAELLGEDFAAMKGYSQNNPHHCYDLMEHTLRTVAALDCSDLSPAQRDDLKIAALYHDVGKPGVAFRKDGRTVYYNHAGKSRDIAELELRRMGADEDTISRICFLVEYHDMFISFKLPDEIKAHANAHIREITKVNVKKAVDKAIRDCERRGGFVPCYDDFKILMRLCAADVLAQSETVILNGKKVDGRAQKTARLLAIRQAMEKE